MPQASPSSASVEGTNESSVKWPYLAMAVICERVLQEKDNVPSLIRIVDRFTIHEKRDSEPPPGLRATLMIAFKSGSYKGKLALRIIHHFPLNALNSRTERIHMAEMTFEGEDKGAGIVLQITLPKPEEGLHWFEVVLEDESTKRECSVTKVPMRVNYQPGRTQGQAQE